jgi:quercetin dioxygenase-like cupin family protein
MKEPFSSNSAAKLFVRHRVERPGAALGGHLYSPQSRRARPAGTPTDGTSDRTAAYAIVGQWPGGFQGEVRTVTGSIADGRPVTQVWTAPRVSYNGSLPWAPEMGIYTGSNERYGGCTTMNHDVTGRTGEMIWMLNTWMRFVATAEDTGGRLAVLEQRLTPAGDPPPHVHANEDETFYVLEGRLSATIGYDTTVSAGPGEFLFLPRGVPHSPQAQSAEVRVLLLITPAGFERFFAAIGQPAHSNELPEPTIPDLPAVAAAAARSGVTVLPPA